MTEKEIKNLEARVQRLEERQKVLENKVLLPEPTVEDALVTAAQAERMLGIKQDIIEMWYQTGMLRRLIRSDIEHKKEHHFPLIEIIRLFNKINYE